MVYYSHYVIHEDIMFEYITHNDNYFIYKLYNTLYPEKSFLLLYHTLYGFSVIRESRFDINIFETNPKIYFKFMVSSRNEYQNGSELICLERSMGAHKYMIAEEDIEKYKVLHSQHINVNNVIFKEDSLLERYIYHFAPNMYCVNIYTMYDFNENGENKPYSSYIYIKYNEHTYQIRYELNNGNIYFM